MNQVDKKLEGDEGKMKALDRKTNNLRACFVIKKAASVERKNSSQSLL